MFEKRFSLLRWVAVLATVAIASFGMMVSPAVADDDTVGACQIVFSSGDIPQDGDCSIAYNPEAESCILTIDGEEYDGQGACDGIVQGNCPYQAITDIDGSQVTLQVQCTQGAVPTTTPTATSVPPTATDVPPTATDVPPTATDVPPTATDVPPTATTEPTTGPTVEPTVEPTEGPEEPTLEPTDTDTSTDTDKDTDEQVTTLPSTGQGPDSGQPGALFLVLGAVSTLLAGAAIAWQRRRTA